MSPTATAQMLQISSDLQLPVDAMTEAIALLSTRGRGKTHTATVIAEEVLKLQHQVVIVDPVGLYWGLRSSADGKGAGFRILVLGGAHGDLPLQAADAGTIAQFIVDEEASVVLDLSAFPSKSEQVRFCEVFFDKLWHLKAAHRTPLLLILEEAQEVAPQRPQANESLMLGRIERIAKLGRNYGIGLLMITQRPASLNKDVLDLAGILILLGLVAPIERKVAREWISGHGDQKLGEEVLASLPALPRGDAWLWWPLQGVMKRMHVRERLTFDSSATPKVGTKRIDPGRRAEIDLGYLMTKLGGLVEKAKADDPKELRRRIQDLTMQLADAKAAHEKDVNRLQRELQQKEPLVVEVPTYPENVREYFRDTAARLIEGARSITEMAEMLRNGAEIKVDRHPAHIKGRTGQPAAGAGALRSAAPPSNAHAVASAASASRRETVARSVPRPDTGLSAGNAGISRPQQKLLDALARLEAAHVATPTRTQAAALASVSPKSSGFEKNVSTLSTAGLVSYPGPGRLQLTADGRAQAAAVDAPPTVEEFQDYICRLVSGPQATLLRELIRIYPAATSRAELAEACNVSALSSGFEKNVSTLSSFGFVVYPERGAVRASDLIFLEGD